MPAIYPLRIFADLGGLMSYGGGLVELLYQQAGIYVGDSQRRHESPLIGVNRKRRFGAVRTVFDSERTLRPSLTAVQHAAILTLSFQSRGAC
jgi:hypothetical protein